MVPLTSLVLAAAAVSAPVLRAERAPKPPVVDGRVDEDIWSTAHPSSNFTQKVPEDGKPPSEPTHVRVLYDDTTIYIAVECEQKTSKLVAPLKRPRPRGRD